MITIDDSDEKKQQDMEIERTIKIYRDYIKRKRQGGFSDWELDCLIALDPNARQISRGTACEALNFKIKEKRRSIEKLEQKRDNIKPDLLQNLIGIHLRDILIMQRVVQLSREEFGYYGVQP